MSEDDDTSNNNTTGNDDDKPINDKDLIDNKDHEDNHKDQENMGKTADKKKPAATAPKKAGTKSTGENTVIKLNPPRSKKQHVANQGATYFSTNTQKGYIVNPYSNGPKNSIDVVFRQASMPPKSAKPMMMLDLGGKALCIEWKVSDCIYSSRRMLYGTNLNSYNLFCDIILCLFWYCHICRKC
jgi:hypothetical protein